jgi:hypothetical protein
LNEFRSHEKVVKEISTYLQEINFYKYLMKLGLAKGFNNAYM